VARPHRLDHRRRCERRPARPRRAPRRRARAEAARHADHGHDRRVRPARRDCAALASNGELPLTPAGLARYKAEYIDAIADIADDPRYTDLRIVAIIEPDGLPNLVTNLGDPECAQAKQTGIYEQAVGYALDKLHAIPNVYTYLDMAHSGWLGWDDNLSRAIALYTSVASATTAGKSSVDGIVTNVANYTPTAEPFLTDPTHTVGGQPVRSARFYEWNPNFDEADYTAALYTAFTGAFGWPAGLGLLVDTSRNGWGGPDRPTGPSASPISTRTSASPQWTAGRTGTSYIYTVKARDAAGNASGASPPTTATTKPAGEDTGKDWLHARGNKVVDAAGNEVWLTGTNWFGFNTSERVFHGLWTANLTDLTTVSVRYYFTRDGGTYTIWCDWAQVGCGNLTTRVVPLAAPVATADAYLEVTFTGGTLRAGDSTDDIQLRASRTDWAPVNETNDYSRGAGTTYADAPRITAHVNGTRAWGEVPA
jgi:hypothetical protein